METPLSSYVTKLGYLFISSGSLSTFLLSQDSYISLPKKVQTLVMHFSILPGLKNFLIKDKTSVNFLIFFCLLGAESFKFKMFKI